jgi:hypothetical protein
MSHHGRPDGTRMTGKRPHPAAVCQAIHQSPESLRGHAGGDGLPPQTVAKPKKRTPVTDAPTEPQQPRSTGLIPAEEALMVACRRPTLLPLVAHGPFLCRAHREHSEN